MSPRKLFILLVFLSSAAFAQGTPDLDPGREPDDRPKPDARANLAPKEDSGDSRPAAAPAQPAKNKTDAAVLGNLGSAGLNQKVLPPAALSRELLVRARTIAVVSESFFVKKEQLEKSLVNRKELEMFGLHVSQDKDKADLVLRVKRAPFQNNFPFTVTERTTGVIVMGGEVNSLFGTVPGKIAGRIAGKLKDIYKTQNQQSQPAPSK